MSEEDHGNTRGDFQPGDLPETFPWLVFIDSVEDHYNRGGSHGTIRQDL
jgi:hypothetical protein